MINSIGSTQSIEIKIESRDLPSERMATAPKGDSDTAEISADAKNHQVYMQAIGKLPEIRPDKISELRAQMNGTQHWPPDAIVNGIITLIGQEISGVENE